MNTPLKFVSALFLFVAASSAQSVDSAESLNADLISSCGSKDAALTTIRHLPDDLAKVRVLMNELDVSQGSVLSQKDAALRKQGKWSDEHDERFFRALNGGSSFQNFELQRGKLVNAYMEATEAIVESLAAGALDQSCKSSVALKLYMRSLYKVTEDQWGYMLSEKDKALEAIQK